MADDVPCCDTKFFLYVIVIIELVLFAGMMAGLTLGLMSSANQAALRIVNMLVLSTKILPVVKNQHLLLCTLLIGNSLAMEQEIGLKSPTVGLIVVFGIRLTTVVLSFPSNRPV